MPELCVTGGDSWDRARTVRAVGAVAGEQWSVIHHSQLRRLGAGSSTVARWAADGWLHRKYPGVYAFGHPRLGAEGLLAAALFYAGNGCVLSHRIAAWWWELVKNEPPVIEISIPINRTRKAPDIVFYRRRAIDRVGHRRLPVTSLGQTLLDFAATEPLDDVRHALAEAEYHHNLDLDRVAQTLGRGRPGSARLRSALALHDPRLGLTQSKLERAFFRLCEEGGFPMPLINQRPCGFKVDAYWPEHRLVVEVDGFDGHHTPAQLERDHQRDLILRRAGMTVRRYAWRQVTRRRPEVIEDLRGAF
jgi:very-short-patch-repair endonuclease